MKHRIKKGSIKHEPASFFKKKETGFHIFIQSEIFIFMLFIISFLISELIILKFYNTEGTFPVLLKALVDINFLSILISPVIYFFVFRPIKKSVIKQKETEKKLEESIERSKGISETGFDAVFIFENNICISQNKTAEIMLGYSKAEALGKPPSHWIHTSDLSKINEALFEETPVQYEIRAVRKDGSEFPALVQSKMIFYDGKNFEIKSLINITPQKKALDNLKLLETVIANANDGIMIAEINPADLSGPTIVYINDAYLKMTGYSKEEIIGKTPRILQGEKTDKLQLKIIKEAILKYEPCEMEVLNYKKNGKQFWSTVSISPVANTEGAYTHWIGIMRDITDQKKQEVAINRAMILAQEKEKYFIGSELHDNVLQILVASLFSSGMIKNLSEKDMFYLNESKKYIKSSIDEIRKVSHQLAPAGFENSSLEISFEKLLNTFNIEKKYAIDLYFDDLTKHPLQPDLKLNLYRILQEQLQNIFKHSNATTIEISVTIVGDKLRMWIFDNGNGFDIHLLKKDGIGLNNIKKRIEMFNGFLTINSSPGDGCEMFIEIPIKNEFESVVNNKN